MKSTDFEEKYKAAVAYYNKKDYYKAGQLFDELLIAFKGDTRFQELYFYYAYSKYGNGELIMASYHFKNYYESFPTSQRAEEALYLHVYCDYLEAYPHFLDPSGTRMAMDNIQLFINLFPNSKYVSECNKYIDDLRGRLRKKSVEAAKLYMRMQDYQGAIMAFNNSIKDYPELENKDEIEMTLIKCQYLLASNSIDSKKAQRFKEIAPMVQVFERRYGRSNKYYSEVLSYQTKALKSLNDLALREGFSYYDRGEYSLAASTFKKQKSQQGIDNKDQLHFWTVRSLVKAGKVSGDKTYFIQAIEEAEAFSKEFGDSNPFSKRVNKLKETARKAGK